MKARTIGIDEESVIANDSASTNVILDDNTFADEVSYSTHATATRHSASGACG